MRIPRDLQPATFVERENRFRATVRLNGAVVPVHVPNPGRMTEMFTPGRRVYVCHRPAPHRVTDYDLTLVEHAGVLVSADTRLPVRIFGEALREGRLADFPGVLGVRPEVPLGSSRIDFLVMDPGGDIYVEVKSVTLIEDRLALFPDSPTTRGKRHLNELQAHVAAGGRAAVVFVVQREDADAVAPYAEADPDFAEALSAAVEGGVRALAYRCRVTRTDIVIVGSVPVRLPVKPRGRAGQTRE